MISDGAEEERRGRTLYSIWNKYSDTDTRKAFGDKKKRRSNKLISHQTHDLNKYGSTYGLDLGILHLNYSGHLQEEHLLKKDKMDRKCET